LTWLCPHEAKFSQISNSGQKFGAGPEKGEQWSKNLQFKFSGLVSETHNLSTEEINRGVPTTIYTVIVHETLATTDLVKPYPRSRKVTPAELVNPKIQFFPARYVCIKIPLLIPWLLREYLGFYDNMRVQNFFGEVGSSLF